MGRLPRMLRIPFRNVFPSSLASLPASMSSFLFLITSDSVFLIDVFVVCAEFSVFAFGFQSRWMLELSFLRFFNPITMYNMQTYCFLYKHMWVGGLLLRFITSVTDPVFDLVLKSTLCPLPYWFYLFDAMSLPHECEIRERLPIKLVVLCLQ